MNTDTDTKIIYVIQGRAKPKDGSKPGPWTDIPEPPPSFRSKYNPSDYYSMLALLETMQQYASGQSPKGVDPMLALVGELFAAFAVDLEQRIVKRTMTDEVMDTMQTKVARTP